MNPTNRPAETGGIATAIAVLIAHLFGVDDSTIIVTLAVIVGFVPAAITWLVTLIRKPKSP
jgi:hypothetical protein